ncbi:MAG: hypothetical protein U0174_03330 [Polyangiaceae bacterium]
MLKVRHIASLTVFGVLSAVLLLDTESRADGDCSTADSCARVVACPGGFEATQAMGGTYCSRQLPERTSTPTCAFHNMRNDWVWIPTAKSCRNGANTYATTNIRCSSGSYSEARGLCVEPPRVEYAHAVMTGNGQFSGTSRTCDNQAACSDAISCSKNGFNPFRVIAPGPNQNKWLCSKNTPGVDEAPKCAFHNMRNDWTFVASIKACRNGAGTTATSNIRCEHGEYSPTSGRCTAASVTEYDDPRL